MYKEATVYYKRNMVGQFRFITAYYTNDDNDEVKIKVKDFYINSRPDKKLVEEVRIFIKDNGDVNHIVSSYKKIC